MIRLLVQSVDPPPHHFNPTFVDAQGVTHETLSTDWDREASLCGKFRWSPRTRLETLRAFARSLAPEGVNCMSCLVRRARLDGMVAGPQPKDGHLVIETDLVPETPR